MGIKKIRMIPVKLTLQGIYSYKERQVVDFGRLTGARLFGIFGRTGSGKSTLVEAITYAIYGETERLNRRDGRSYNMMNLRSNELLIDFEFTAGTPTRHYRCIVKGQRNRKRFDDAKTFDHTAYQFSGEAWLPVSLGQVQQAVGLSYDNFRRAVIIPQGRFQDFLQLTDADRTRMMKELFDLDRFDLAPRVGYLEKRNNENIVRLEALLSKTISHDETWFSQQQLLTSQLKQALAEDQVAINQLKIQIARFNELASLHKEASEKQQQLDALLAQAETIAALEQQSSRVSRCMALFKPALDLLEENTSRLALIVGQHAALQAEFERLQPSLKKSAHEMAAAEEDYLKNPVRRERISQLRRQAEQCKITIEISDIKKRIVKGEQLLEAELAKAEPLNQQAEQQQKLLDELDALTSQLPLLAALLQWFDIDKRLTTEHKNLSQSVETIQVQKAGLETENELLNLELQKASPSALFADAEPLTAMAAFAQWEAALREEEQHHALRLKMQSLADELADETPCPVCGSLHHPAPASTENLDENAKQINRKRLALDHYKSTLDRVNRQLAHLEGRRASLRQTQTDLLRQLEENEATRANHQALFNGEELYSRSDEEAVKQAWSDSQLYQKQRSLTATNLQSLQKQKANLDTTLTRYRERIAMLNQQLVESLEKLATLQQQEAFGADQLQSDPATLIAEAEGLANEMEAAALRRDQTAQAYRQLAETVAQNTTRREILLVQAAELKNLITNRQHELEQQALAQGFDGVEAIREVLSTPFDTEAARRQISTYKEMVATLQGRLKEIVPVLKAEPYDPLHHEETVIRLENLSINLQETTLLLDRAERQLIEAQESREETLRLTEALHAARIRAENLEVLARMFKGSGFVNYVSAIYLQQLVGIANKRFHTLTNRQLSMELADGNNIVVRDYLNGGHTRSVKTLSGGQTFQASLSLALALADVVHARRPGTDNFFFLDEGFGSLDRDSLQTVFDTLRTLRLENRIVGLISHVEELQQEIDASIRIENHDEAGSRVIA
jgi:exonuclease SbcC